MFQLRKWYLDLVTEDGTALIGYAARLHWGPLRLAYASLLRALPRGSAEEHTTLGHFWRPVARDGQLEWHSPPLDFQGSWHGDTPPIQRLLARTPDGTILWRCHQPRAEAQIHIGSESFTGLGYVESLRLTLPPWRLPFRHLRWGRYLSSLHSVIWIAWQGETDCRWVWLDGALQRDAEFDETGRIQLDGGMQLELGGSRDLRDRQVLSGIADLMPSLARRLPRSIAGMHEHKMLSRGLLSGPDGATDRGWALHEVVRW